MKRAFIRREKLFQNDGFTLIELLMVVIILGILASVVIPQFSGSSKDAKESTLRSNLVAIRGALELYGAQHNGEYPNATDPNVFIDQLTQYSNIYHQLSTTKNPSYPYGPYIKYGFPKNPFARNEANADEVYIVTTNDPIGTFNLDPNKGGWLFKTTTGEFIANVSGYDHY